MNNCWKYIEGTPIFIGQRDFTVYEYYQWLEQFKPAHRIANFGCAAIPSFSDDKPSQYMTEPFGLLWALDAIQVDVVEIEKDYVENARLCVEDLSSQYPECFQDRKINIICGDMKEFILEAESYHIAYCERVIKYSGIEGLKAMVDCVKPKGLVIIVAYKSTEIDRLAKSLKRLSIFENIDESQIPYNFSTDVETRVYQKL